MCFMTRAVRWQYYCVQIGIESSVKLIKLIWALIDAISGLQCLPHSTKCTCGSSGRTHWTCRGIRKLHSILCLTSFYSVSYLLRNSVGSIKALWGGAIKGGGGGLFAKVAEILTEIAEKSSYREFKFSVFCAVHMPIATQWPPHTMDTSRMSAEPGL